MKIDALQKWQNELLADLSPAVIGFLKHSYRTGRLLDIDRLYSTMFHDWDVLQKDCCDMEEAVRSLEWSVMPKCKAGEEPDALAQEVAQVVEEALWRRSAGYEARAYSHTFPELVGALVHALFRGYNVHEIVWENDGELVFPARYVQLPAQFLAWEDKAGRPDRLLLVRDGMGEEPVPFPAWKFIVALNTTGPDHPIFNAAYFSLVKWFTAFKFGLGWYMEYCQKYGIPTKVIQYGNEAERQKIIDSMQDERVLNTVFVQEGRKYELGHAPASGASLPQRDLVQLAEAACHKLILGQTLTSDTSEHGGSLAQARVHAGVQADVVKKRAEYVAEVLNAQLIPAIVLANFGRLEGMPLPELRCKLPEAVANTAKAQFWKAVLEIPGMRAKQSEVYESLGIAQPGDGDAVFGGTKDPSTPIGYAEAGEGRGAKLNGGAGDVRSAEGKAAGPSSSDPGQGRSSVSEPEALRRDGTPRLDAPKLRGSGDDVQGAKAAERKEDAAQVWLEPLRRELQEARRNGSTLADIRAGLAKWRPDTQALAGVFAANAEQGFFGVQEEQLPDDVAAANPYGCNQYGEGWRQPHNGLGSKPGKPVKKGDKKAEEKKQEPPKKELSDDERRKKAIERCKKALRPRNGEEAKVSFDDSVPPEMIEETADTLEDLQRKYPTTMHIVGSVDAKNDNTGAWATSYKIEINHDRSKGGVFDLGRWKSYDRDKQERTGFTRHNVGATDKGISLRDVVTHEYGHVLQRKVDDTAEAARDRKRWGWSVSPDSQQAIDINARLKRAFTKAKKTGDIYGISEYAKKNHKEFFAECFAARERGEKIPDYVNKVLDEVIEYAKVRA